MPEIEPALIHWRGCGVSVLIDCHGDGLPRILYWGGGPRVSGGRGLGVGGVGWSALAGPIAICADAAAGRVCIDLTEITNHDYAAFVDRMNDDDARAKVSASLPPPCAPFVSAAGVNPSVAIPADRACNPVTYVNWCQAHAYCRSVGKRMCGAIGDGGVMRGPAPALDPRISEWVLAAKTTR